MNCCLVNWNSYPKVIHQRNRTKTGRGSANCLATKTVGKQGMVGSLPNFFFAANASTGGMDWIFVNAIAHMGKARNLIDGHPVGDAIAQTANNGSDIICKIFCYLPTAP